MVIYCIKQVDILSAPDTLFRSPEIRIAVIAVKALSLGQLVKAIPGGCAAIPEIHPIAKTMKSLWHCRRVSFLIAFRHIVCPEADIPQVGNYTVYGYGSEIAIWQEALDIAGILFCNETSEAICSMQLSILIKHWPLSPGFSHDNEDMPWLRQLCSGSPSRDIVAELI